MSSEDIQGSSQRGQRLVSPPESAARHTPGPWNTAATDDSLVLIGRQKIASTYPVPGDDWGAANARLIAAAPELLTEAEELCAILDNYRADTGEGYCYDHDAIGEEIARRHESLTAAIAKARGQ